MTRDLEKLAAKLAASREFGLSPRSARIAAARPNLAAVIDVAQHDYADFTALIARRSSR
jgi:hypothetical protein